MSGTLFIPPMFQPLGVSGNRFPGGRLYFYQTGTSTPASTYTTAALSVEHAHPIVADSTGTFASIYLNPDAGYNYRVVLQNAAGVQQRAWDNVPATGSEPPDPISQADVGAALWPRTAREIASGIYPTVYYYEPGDVRRYGAVGDGVVDDTSAIQAALNVGGDVYFPRGTYKITSALVYAGYGRTIRGAGKELAVLVGTFAASTTACIYSATDLVRLNLSDLHITGNGRGIHFTQTCYESEFRNLYIDTAEQCVYMPNTAGTYGPSFSNTFTNCDFASTSSHGVEVVGGPGFNFVGCYAHKAGTNKAGFRIYTGANFYGCNGVDTAGIWGVFGAETALGDVADQQYYARFYGCNFESYTDHALEFRYEGQANIEGCTFQPPATYVTSIICRYNTRGLSINSCTFAPVNGAAGAPADWEASTAYKVGAWVMNGAKIYTCATAGTSAGSGGPTGTGSGITDGTAVWNYVSAGVTRTYKSDLYTVSGMGLLLNQCSGMGPYPKYWSATDGVMRAAAQFKSTTASSYLNDAVELSGLTVAGDARFDGATQTTVGAAGGASALPGTPTGYLKVYVGATAYVVPYYAVS